MDLVNGGRFLLEMLKTNKIVDNVPIQPEGDMPLKMVQEYLLKNAQLHGSRFQYFSKEELNIYAVNPPLEPGQNILNIRVKELGGSREAFMLENIHPNTTILYLHKLIKQKTDGY